MSAPKRESVIKVGILTLVSLAILIVSLVWLQGSNFSQAHPYKVVFQDVDGLREGAPVQLMGIRVGFVETVVPRIMGGRYYVEVTFSLQNEEAVIPKGSTLSIEQSGLIGEKYIEVTPPQQRETLVATLRSNPNRPIPRVNQLVKMPFKEGILPVGIIEKVQYLHPPPGKVKAKTDQFLLTYRITRPGVVMPKNPIHILEPTGAPDRGAFLKIISTEKELPLSPDRNLVFTVEEPLRMKEFLEIQLEAAESLRLTNEKVAQLLSDDTIATLTNTLDNVEVLTAKSAKILDSADLLLKTTSRDLELLVKESHQLTENITVVSNHLNDVIGDPRFKEDILSTMDSIKESTDALNDIIKDSSLKETIIATRDASKSISEMAQLFEATAKDKALQQRLDRSLTLLSQSLDKLDRILGDVEEATGDDTEPPVKAILEDTRQTSRNLKTFSQKLNKRFLLFRLMF